jgi:hypothetical protein
LFRRDHLLLAGPGFAGESWHNQVHDVVSGVAYRAMLAALAVLASRIAGPYNGVVQRIAVTLALPPRSSSPGGCSPRR